jgi:pimeloyl-ACP methyl ester carboxylesterase
MSLRRTAVQVVAGSGLALVGGLLVDRRLGARRRASPADVDGVPLGSLRGTAYEVEADDGVVLHAEVDELSPYGSADPGQREHDGPATVVLIHGFSLTMDCWHFQRQAFRGKRRLVLYDQRSHGRSGRSPQENATIDQLGKDLLTVIDRLAPDEPVVLVGHSMGGMSVVALAEQHPELFGDRIVGVALISTTAGGQRTHKIFSRFIPDAVGRRVVERGLLLAAERERILELARRNGSAIALRFTEEFAFGDEPVPRAYVAFLDSMISATPLKVLVEFIPQFDALDKFHVLAAFSEVPTWIMCGTKDKLTSVDHARRLHASISGSRLSEFEGGGHVAIMEFKDDVNANLETLFEDADRRHLEER